MKKIFIIIIVLGSLAQPQNIFRNGVFLHHSTGLRIWDYAPYGGGASTSIPIEIAAYNTTKGYSGDTAFSINESWFPSMASGLGNDWFNWHWIFDNLESQANIYEYFENYNIIVIKSCSPATDMTGYGSPDDTSGSGVTNKTIYNYKWHWRSIVTIMENHPDKFFVIWTQAPQAPQNTTELESRLSHEFSTWAKDTLAMGIDPIYGEFPENVYVFDYFHKMANPNANPIYSTNLALCIAPDDDHPNAAATDLIAPQFVQETFDAVTAYETIIPVELISFRASIIPTGVQLFWSTATELNNDGFEIERIEKHQAEAEEWSMIGFVKGHGTSINKNDYSFIDKMTISGQYLYRLKQIDFDGNYEYSKAVEVDFDPITSYKLEQNYPNPFNPATTIRFNIPESGDVKLSLFNILGQEISTLVNKFIEAGVHTINFDASGLNSGMYIYKIEAGTFVQARKMLLLK